MVKNFLITRPNHDRITSYLHDFAKGIVKIVKESRDIHVTDLEGVQATREHLEKALKESPKLVFLNGHGDRKSVAGHKNEIVLDKNNICLTKDKIVYALSCNSLERLGQIAVEKAGAKAYIGYQARFMLVCDPSRESSPHKDKNALPFKRACFALINSLVMGMAVHDAIECTKKEYKHSIASYGTSEDDPYGDVPLIRFALAWDLEFLDMCGDSNARFN